MISLLDTASSGSVLIPGFISRPNSPPMDWLTFALASGLTLLMTYVWIRHINRGTQYWQNELSRIVFTLEPMETEQKQRLLYWQMVDQVSAQCPDLLLPDENNERRG